MVRVTVVVFVTPPPVPVTVMVRVPVVAVFVTLICIVAWPEPGAAIEAGWKCTVTPDPCPDAVKAIAELKPPETVVVILDVPCPACLMVTLFGDAETVNDPPPVPVTVSVTVVVCTVLPAVPVTVIV